MSWPWRRTPVTAPRKPVSRVDGARSALIVASYDYEDPGLRRLRAPARDAEALAEVLRDPAIGGFDVRTVRNEPAHVVSVAVEQFFANRSVDDLLLVHFSGHGVKDESGDLYFAAANTRLVLLAATAVSSDFVNRLMNRTRARRVVLLLDCCYAGAFERGLSTRSDTGLHLEERLGGRGRAVITASTAMEYAFEGKQLTDTADSQPSVFTSALVDGLKTGDADTDQDGMVGLDELYEYVYEKVRSVTPNQTPSKWALGFQGELYIARRSQPVTTPAPLPDGLHEALESPFVGVRSGAVHELERLLRGRHAGRAVAARQALERLSDDDSRTVANAAAAALATAPMPEAHSPPAGPPSSPGPARDDLSGSQPDVHEASFATGPETESPDDAEQAGEQPPREPPEEPVEEAAVDDAGEEPHPTRFHLTRPAKILLGGAAVAVVLAATALVLWEKDEGSTTDGPVGPTVPDNHIVLTSRVEEVEGVGRMLSLDVETGESTRLLQRRSGRLPTISPDRSTIIYLTTEEPATPRVMNADGSEDHPLFDSSSPCEHSSRPAWKSDGKELAVICIDGGEPTLKVVDLAGQLIDSLDVDGTPAGAPTWARIDDREVVVYMRTEGGDDRSTLWMIDPAERNPAMQLTNGDGSDSHPDWGENGLLFLRSSETGKTGDVWVRTADGERRIEGLSGVQSPTWSTFGDSIAFVSEGRLWLANYDGTDRRPVADLEGKPGPPAWGTR